MPNRLSRLFSASKEAEANLERSEKSSSPPAPLPQYAANQDANDAPPDYDPENRLDPPDITAGFSQLNLSGVERSDLPTPDECVAHLKLLEAFYRLRQTVGSCDGAFGIHDSLLEGVSVSSEDLPKLQARLAEKRWSIFVTRAVDRFESWLDAVCPASPLRFEDLRSRGKEGSLLPGADSKSMPLALSKDDLPPVDVLMVWHAYMLNPRAYLEDCIRLGRISLWQTSFPWALVAEHINSTTFIYEVSSAVEESFTKLTSHAWTNLGADFDKKVACPTCGDPLFLPWTLSVKNETNSLSTSSDIDGLLQDLDHLLTRGMGFCDKNFTAKHTECGTVFDHDSLVVARFRRDVGNIMRERIPMAGTILDSNGFPGKYPSVPSSISQWEIVAAFPNHVMLTFLGSKILESSSARLSNMEDVRALLTTSFANKANVRKARTHAVAGRTIVRTENRAIRQMMARYQDNQSSFALDLVGAVIRQSSFVEKMHGIDWLHSPALPSTMTRLVRKYTRFMQLMQSRESMAVPTLDVDLAWHTHQLSPRRYMQYSTSTTHQFIDHDDKVSEVALDKAFAWTSKTYEKRWNEPYSECTCWYCEAIRESNSNSVSRLFHRNDDDARLHDVDQSPEKSVHISAHNAIRPDNSAAYSRLAEIRAQELEKHYAKACERARKKGRKEPRRDDYYYSSAWGYPVYIPAYSPYLGYMPYAAGYYPINPGCAALGLGAGSGVGGCSSAACAAAGAGCAVASNCGGAGAACGGSGGGSACGGGGGGCGGGGGGGCGGGGS